MAKGDSAAGAMGGFSSPMPMFNYGMPQQGNSISQYGMSSLAPTMSMMRAFPQFGQVAGNSPGLFRMMMNPGFNFNTPISQSMPQGNMQAVPRNDMQMMQGRRGPFASFAGNEQKVAER